MFVIRFEQGQTCKQGTLPDKFSERENVKTYARLLVFLTCMLHDCHHLKES